MQIFANIQKFFNNFFPHHKHHFVNDIPLDCAVQEVIEYLKTHAASTHEDSIRNLDDVGYRHINLKKVGTEFSVYLCQSKDDDDWPPESIKNFTISIFVDISANIKEVLPALLASMTKQMYEIQKYGNDFQPTDTMNCHRVRQSQFKFENHDDAFIVSSTKLCFKTWSRVLDTLTENSKMTSYVTKELDCFIIDLGSLSDDLKGAELVYYRKYKKNSDYGNCLNKNMMKDIATNIERELKKRYKDPKYSQTI